MATEYVVVPKSQYEREKHVSKLIRRDSTTKTDVDTSTEKSDDIIKKNSESQTEMLPNEKILQNNTRKEKIKLEPRTRKRNSKRNENYRSDMTPFSDENKLFPFILENKRVKKANLKRISKIRDKLRPPGQLASPLKWIKLK